MTVALQPSKTEAILNAATLTPSTGSTFAIFDQGQFITYQSVYGSAPSAVNITIQGSSDNTSWQTLATLTTTTGETGNIQTSLPYIRAKINSNTGGSTVTLYVTVKSYNAVKTVGGLLHQASVILSNSQILTLPSLPIDLVAAPGAGKALVGARRRALRYLLF